MLIAKASAAFLMPTVAYYMIFKLLNQCWGIVYMTQLGFMAEIFLPGRIPTPEINVFHTAYLS